MQGDERRDEDAFKMPALSGEEALRRHREALNSEEAPNALAELPWLLRVLIVGVGLCTFALVVVVIFYFLSV